MNDSDDPEGMTPKQAEFCRQYMIDLNATQAAIRAGYSEKTAAAIGPENLKKPLIASDIARRKRDRAIRTTIDADRVLAEIARLAFSDIRGIVNGPSLLRVETLSDDTAAALQSVKVSTRRVSTGSGDEVEYEDVTEYKFADKRGPLELLGKHLDLWGSGDMADESAEPVTSITYVEEDASHAE